MQAPVIKLTQIEKTYPGVKPLDKVDFVVLPGEVHALLGENGAGKSTLTRIIGGASAPDGGSIEYLGKPVIWRSPRQALDAGIHIIHQELAVFSELSVAENILVRAPPRTRLGLISPRKRRRAAEEILRKLGVSIDPDARVGELPLATQQMVEIAKALVGQSRLVVFDEPTAVIVGRDVDLLFDNMRKLRGAGIGIVFISHRLDEIYEIADRVTVLKDGRVVGVSRVVELNRDRMVNMMVGRRIDTIFPSKASERHGADEVLSIQGLRSGERVRDVSLSVKAGEIVCLAGMAGSGRTEVAQAVFGERRIDAGTIAVDGRPLRDHKPRRAIAMGLGFLTENRKDEGLFLDLSVAANISAPSLKAIADLGLLNRKRELEIARQQIAAFAVATRSPDMKVVNLSGGNQQKVLFSRWSRIADRLLILDEPTRGVDVGAKVEIYRLVREIADRGIAILMISSELPEVVGLSDHVVVMAQGRVSGELRGDAITEEAIMRLAVVAHGRAAETPLP